MSHVAAFSDTLFAPYSTTKKSGIFSWSPRKIVSNFLVRMKERAQEKLRLAEEAEFADALSRLRDTPYVYGKQREKDVVTLTKGLKAHPARNTHALYQPVIDAGMHSASPSLAALVEKIVNGNPAAEKYSFKAHLKSFSDTGTDLLGRIEAARIAQILQGAVKKHPEWITADLFDPLISHVQKTFHPDTDELLRTVVTNNRAAETQALKVLGKDFTQLMGRNFTKAAKQRASEAARPPAPRAPVSRPVETPVPGPFIVEEPAELSPSNKLRLYMKMLSDPNRVSVHRTEVFDAVHFIDASRQSEFDRLKSAIPRPFTKVADYTQCVAA